MKSMLTKVQVLGLLIALPALANDVGLHKGSAQPTRANEPSQIAAQALLEQAQSELNLEEGDISVFILDMPPAPPQSAPVMIAQANQAQMGTNMIDRAVGVCHIVPNGANSLENTIESVGEAREYFRLYEHRTVTGQAKVTILQNPKHGILRLVTEADRGTIFDSSADLANRADGLYAYLPEKGYLGKDQATVLVEIGGFKVKVDYFFQAIDGVATGNTTYKDLCGKKGYSWKISRASEIFNPQSEIEQITQDNNALAQWLPSASTFNYLNSASSVTYTFTNLPGTSVGQTTGEGINASILLDTNAAGYGWFIDSTPFTNEEFLPTSNPNEWVAKAGSAAEGKMDLLSVLLHEYGHALGIEHSADSHDYMATTLQPGVRRLPSSEELALMAQLIGGLKTGQDDTPINPSLPIGTTLGALLLGRMRRTDYGTWSPVFDSVQISASAPQFEVAANPKLQNKEFDGGAGWNTEGTVAFANGAATLRETASSQTRLNQVFVLGEHDRFLSFTLANTALGDQAGPDDAFEVALLDANTGHSLMGATGLTRNDAFLNLQANGTEHKASGITRIDNADGSRTYLVDLAGIAAGTTVNLAFDLIGFGLGAEAGNSRLTIRDLRLGVPQIADDSVAFAEDTPTVIDALANDLNAHQPGFAPIVVSGPAHGQVAINADGSFSFTPERDWYGEDAFTYKLSDGHVDSPRHDRVGWAK